MNCWHCKTELIWGGDHDLEKDDNEILNATLAEAYLDLGYVDSAVVALKKSYKLTENNELRARKTFIIGQLFQALGEPDSALVRYEKLIDLNRKIPKKFYIHSYIEKSKISFINIAPGPIKTKRLERLLKAENISIENFAKNLPTSQVPEPDEIGLFVKFVIENKIKSFNGVTIPFDSGLLKSI